MRSFDAEERIRPIAPDEHRRVRFTQLAGGRCLAIARSAIVAGLDGTPSGDPYADVSAQRAHQPASEPTRLRSVDTAMPLSIRSNRLLLGWTMRSC